MKYVLCLLLFILTPDLRAQNAVPVAIRVLEAATGKPTPVRVRITRVGRPFPGLPAEALAVMYGLWDHADGYGFQPDSSFYTSGTFRLSLPPGPYQLTLSKGPEFLDQQHELVVRAANPLSRTFSMKRWIDMAARGWYSADDHIHIRRSPRENPILLDWLRAEDLNVGVLLKMGDFWETYYPQYAFGTSGNYQKGNFLLTSGQEDPRTPELGHALGLGADKSVRYRDDYYYYDKVFDELHRRGGLTGYAHQAESFHGYRGLTLDGLRRKVDLLEILQFCHDEQPLRTAHFYHLLDLGYALTAVAGSDFPWCGHDHQHGPAERTARIGNARFYTHLDGPFTYEKWLQGVRRGHTFATTGPMLHLRVGEAMPGDTLRPAPGDSLTITAQAFGHRGKVPLERLEIVGHGQVLASVSTGAPEQTAENLTLRFRYKPEHGLWLAARCYAGPQQIAHTTPVYISLNGSGFHNPATVRQYLDLSERYLQEIEKELDQERDKPEFRAWYYRKGLKERIAETRRIVEELRGKLK